MHGCCHIRHLTTFERRILTDLERRGPASPEDFATGRALSRYRSAFEYLRERGFAAHAQVLRGERMVMATVATGRRTA